MHMDIRGWVSAAKQFSSGIIAFLSTVVHPRQMNLKWVCALCGAVVFAAPVLRAAEQCPAEVKLLLSPSTLQSAIASLGFGNAKMTRVYLYDTDALDLLTQGIIIRLRQGAKNDLTVKVRVAAGNERIDRARLREQFPCEIDRTRSVTTTSYAVARKYQSPKVPEMGDDVYALFNASQIKLLRQAHVSIDWTRVARIADINSTKWETSVQLPAERLALELWEWPAGRVLELSARVNSDAEASTLAELERLVKTHNLPLSASQDSKTGMVLETLANHPSSPR